MSLTTYFHLAITLVLAISSTTNGQNQKIKNHQRWERKSKNSNGNVLKLDVPTETKTCKTGSDIAINNLGSCVDDTSNKSSKTGCSNRKCEKMICSTVGDPFCCNDSWDGNCIESAKVYCTRDLLPRNTLSSSCFSHSTTSGCNNASCQKSVCDLNELCCTSSWSWDCVLLAMDHCCIEDFDEKRIDNDSSPSTSVKILTTTSPTIAPVVEEFNVITVQEQRTNVPISVKTLIEKPTDVPSNAVTIIISTSSPTNVFTDTPTKNPTDTPTKTTTDTPTNTPSDSPTDQPTSDAPSNVPTNQPSASPTNQPSASPTDRPTNTPSDQPSNEPTNTPTDEPTSQPSDEPSQSPTNTPTELYCTTASYYDAINLGDCTKASNSKGCSNKKCEQLICNDYDDSYCCNSQWDTNCADSAKLYCKHDNLPSLDTTCFSHSSIDSGCDNQKCENFVCAFESFCCSSSWSFDCVLLAIDFCCLEDFENDNTLIIGDGGKIPNIVIDRKQDIVSTDSPTTAASTIQVTTTIPTTTIQSPSSKQEGTGIPDSDVSCKTGAAIASSKLENCILNHANDPQNSKGCTVPSCEEKVCAKDSFCCDKSWDDNCAHIAKTTCIHDELPTHKTTCYSHSNVVAGCDDKKCEDSVCNLDRVCCTSSWSWDCVLSALELCCLDDFE